MDLKSVRLNEQDYKTLESIKMFMANALFDPLAELPTAEKQERVATMLQAMLVFITTFIQDYSNINYKDVLEVLEANCKDYYKE